MKPADLAIAEQVIRGADRVHPADRVLREVLRSEREVGPAQARRISRAAFAFYRWRGWLTEDAPLRESIREALNLATRFAENPSSFQDAELLERAFPAWVAAEVDLSPALLRAFQCEPIVWLRTGPGQAEAVAAKLPGAQPFNRGLLTDAIKYLGSQDLFRTPEFHAGEFELQDISSQAVGVMCGAKPGETWWDACAGEGGKTMHLSDLMANKGLIWASDIAIWRLEKLKRRAARAKVFNYRVAPWNGESKLPTKTKFDGVLVDATCTGTGTWHRNPHARWTTRPEDVQELATIQQRLLGHAAAAVKPGGKLIYSVCSLTRSETAGVADTFERTQDGFEPVELPNPFSGRSRLRVTLLPQDFGGNGMFVAAWRRK